MAAEAGAALACAWVGALWLAAPLLGAPRSLADRLRDTLVLGIAIPGGLGVLGILRAPACWIAVAACLGVRATRAGFAPRSAEASAEPQPSRTAALRNGLGVGFPVAAAAAIAWPFLAHPIAGGDSLIYHLPNAASWVTSGSLWTTITRYWWYPGGSELFAAGMFAAAGPVALGLCGALPLVLLGLRLAAWARALGVPSWVGGAIGAATITVPVFGTQSGNLDNDAWLAAFVVEVLWAAQGCGRGRASPRDVVKAVGAGALVKPFGVLLVVVAALAARAPRKALLAGLVPFGLWALRDAVLAPHALIPIASVAYPVFGTTVAAAGPGGFLETARAVAAQSWWLVLLLAAGIAGLFVAAARPMAVTATATLAIFAVLPFTYAWGGDPHQGIALRYADPAFAAAAAALVALAPLAPAWIGGIALAFGLIGIDAVAAVRQGNPLAPLPTVIALAALGLVAASRRRWRPALVSAAVLAGVGLASRAAGDPAEFYDRALAAPTGVFGWIADARPPRVVVLDVSGGMVNMVSPSTRVADGLDADPCGESRRLDALLVAAVRRVGPPHPEDALHQAAIARCGHALYRDAAAVVLAP